VVGVSLRCTARKAASSYLGFKYLWINSLCIFQDDQKDWERESSQIASIYGCLSINSATTGAVAEALGFSLIGKKPGNAVLRQNQNVETFLLTVSLPFRRPPV
jgi:hypothetical protein